MKLAVKKLDPRAVLPHYAKVGDAGLDLYTLEDTVIPSSDRVVVRTGVAVEIPDGFVGLVWDRSGNAAKRGLTILGGVIDSGYRGEILAITLNTSSVPVTVKAGERIGQLIIQAVECVEVMEQAELSASARGADGLGSTGH